MTRQDLINEEKEHSQKIIETINKIPEATFPIISHFNGNTVFLKTVRTVEEVVEQIDLVTDSFNLYNYYPHYNSICFSHMDEENNIRYNFYCQDMDGVLKDLLMLDCEVREITNTEKTIICLGKQR